MIVLVLLLLLVSSCAPLPTPSSNTSSQSNSPSSNSTTASNSDWQQFLTITSERFDVCYDRVLPIAINPNGNVQDQIWNTNPDVMRLNWTVPIFDSSWFLFELTSISDNDWIEISKSLNVNVSTSSNIPSHIDILTQACGGAGQVRDFSSIDLRTDLNSFSKEAIFAGADFFTLQPGEFEVFSIPFQCNAPGYYKISITSEYSYQGDNGIIEFPEFNALCPQSATVYYGTDADGTVVGAANFTWKNGKYIQSP